MARCLVASDKDTVIKTMACVLLSNNPPLEKYLLDAVAKALVKQGFFYPLIPKRHDHMSATQLRDYLSKCLKLGAVQAKVQARELAATITDADRMWWKPYDGCWNAQQSEQPTVDAKEVIPVQLDLQETPPPVAPPPEVYPGAPTAPPGIDYEFIYIPIDTYAANNEGVRVARNAPPLAECGSDMKGFIKEVLHFCRHISGLEESRMDDSHKYNCIKSKFFSKRFTKV